jgi:hypothetical protein
MHLAGQTLLVNKSHKRCTTKSKTAMHIQNPHEHENVAMNYDEERK